MPGQFPGPSLVGVSSLGERVEVHQFHRDPTAGHVPGSHDGIDASREQSHRLARTPDRKSVVSGMLLVVQKGPAGHDVYMQGDLGMSEVHLPSQGLHHHGPQFPFQGQGTQREALVHPAGPDGEGGLLLEAFPGALGQGQDGLV